MYTRAKISECDKYISEVSTKVSAITLDSEESDVVDVGVECKISSNPLIVGGEDAHPGEFPHMVNIIEFTL